MSHMVDSIAYCGETPWHKLGTRVPEELSHNIPHFFSQAGLNWEVEMARMWYTSPHDIRDTSVSAIVRTDTWDSLGHCGGRYEPLQNMAMAQSLQALTKAGVGTVEVCGALYGGRTVWALIRACGEGVRVGGNDLILPYLLATNSHDGKSCARLLFTPIRVVCHNTLSVAGDVGLLTMSHIGDVNAKWSDLVRQVREKMASAEAQYESLLSKHMFGSRVRAVLKGAGMWDDEGQCPTKSGEHVIWYAEHGKGNTGTTMWDLYNGYTEWSQHTRFKDPEAFSKHIDSGKFLALCERAGND